MCLWVKKHKKFIQEQKKKRGETSVQSTIGRVGGQPFLIEEVLDPKLRSILANLRTAGLIRANSQRISKYTDFKETRSWV